MIYGWLKRALTIGVLVGGTLTAPVAQSETLTDAFVLAYKNSHLLEQQRALLRAADEDVVQAAASLLPVVSFVANSSFYSPAIAGGVRVDNWSSTMALSATLTLYDNGVTRFATDAAKETVLGVRGALLQVEQEVLYSTVQVYMEMIRAAQSVSLGQSNVRVITTELRAARDRFEVGEVTRTDVSIAEARLAAARGNLAAAQGDLEIARENYKAVVGQYPGNLRWPTAPSIGVRTEDAAKAQAVRNHPSIEEAQRNVNATEANVLRTKASMGLKVTSSAKVTLDDSFESSFSGGVTATVPIYQGGTLRSVMRKAMANRDGVRSALLQSVVRVKLQVGTAWATLAVARAQTEASRQQVSASQIAYNGVREEAKFGSRTTLDVLNAEQEVLDARSTLISAEVQQYVATYALLSSMGLLTAEKLNLGIVTYDPIEYYKYATKGSPIRALSRQGTALERVLNSIGGN